LQDAGNPIDKAMKTIHQNIIILIYSAILCVIVWLAYKGGPSDAEMRLRASDPIAQDPFRSLLK
jgi:hypothetical protein